MPTNPLAPEPAKPGVSSAQAAQNRRLFQFGGAALAALCLWLAWQSPVRDTLLLAAEAIIVLAAWPALVWAKKGARGFPVFEVFLLTFIPFYAMPLLQEHEALESFDPSVQWKAALGVILFELLALAGFASGRTHPRKTNFWTEPIFSDALLRRVNLGMAAYSVYLFVDAFTGLIPYEFNSIARALCTGLGIICAFMESFRWGEGRLTAGEKVFFAVNVFFQVAVLFSSLYLNAGGALLIIAAIGYVAGSRKIPLVPMLIATVLLGVLHSGKAKMRLIYWQPDSPAVRFTELPAFFSAWFQDGLTATHEEATVATHNLLERASLVQMLCLGIDRIPEYQPYLEGETYQSIPAMLVPHLLWPGKPSPAASGIKLSIYLGLLTPDTEQTVSIAFGTLTEAYVNFGFLGLAFLGFAYGFGFRKITDAAANSPPLSAAGLFKVLLVAWCFSVEMTLAGWVSSLFQAAIAMVVAPWLLKRFFFNKA